MRRALMDDQVTRFGATLDLDQSARELSTSSSRTTATRRRCWCWRASSPPTRCPASRLGGAAPHRRRLRRRQRGVGRHVPLGEVLALPGGHPVRAGAWRRPAGPRAARRREAPRPSIARRVAARARSAELLSDASMLLLPMIARRRHARLLRLHPRAPGSARSTPTTSRSGWSSPPARRSSSTTPGGTAGSAPPRSTLQRSLLPTGLSAPSSVEVRHRYLPGSKLDRGRRRLVRVDRAARRAGSRWSSATSPGTASGPRSPWGGCAPRSTRWPTWSCRPPRRCSGSTS